jgi:hypothetical protein
MSVIELGKPHWAVIKPLTERQAREIEWLKGRLQREEQRRRQTERLLRLLAVAHIKQQQMPTPLAGAIAYDAGDKRYHATAELLGNAVDWLNEAAGPDYLEMELEVEARIDRMVVEFREKLLSTEGFDEGNIANIPHIYRQSIQDDIRADWLKAQEIPHGAKVVPLAKDTQVDDLRRRIAALSRDVAAHQERFGRDPQVVAWLREITPTPTEPAEPK